MSILFISYRRQDAAGHAGAVFDRLNSVYPYGQVFIDVNEARAGESWSQRLALTIHRSLVILCVIGRYWDASRKAD
jgi:hypothetical protein